MSAPLDQTLAHSALSLLKKVDNRHLQAVARQEMKKEFPHVAEELLDEHLDFAARLLERACFYAEKVRDQNFPEEKAMARLKAELPGMIEKDYLTAMSHGYFYTR
jgi:hypothetical protein